MAKTKKKSSDSGKSKKPAAKSQADKKTLKKASAKEEAAASQVGGKGSQAKAAASKSKAPSKAKNPKPKDQDEDPIDFEDFEGSDESLEGLDLDEMDEEEDEAEEVDADEDLDTDSDDEESLSAEEASSDEIVLTDAEGNRYCRARDCDQIASVEAYCRYHYLLFWRKIQVRKKILDDGKLERYVEELTSRYPDKFVEMIRKDLRNEKDFLSAIQELEIDESGLENEDEDDTQSFVDEIRGMGGGESEGVEEDF